jgi:beta-lactamase class D
MSLTKEVMVMEETPAFRLSAKTGACHPAGEDVALWYIGYVERPDNELYYFAMEMADTQYEPLMSARVPKTRAILTELGILP